MTEASVYITATGAFLPNDPVGNDDMERVLGQVGDKPSRARRTILRSNGIKSRHYAIDPHSLQFTHNNAGLAAEAVRSLARPGFSLGDIDCLACGTSIPDQLMPGHAAMVQGELGLPPCEVVSTSGVCLAGIGALKYAVNAVRAGDRQHAVATGSELSSASMRAENFTPELDSKLAELEKQPELAFEKDFLRWMLSDGGGAVLVEREPRSDGGLSLRVDWIDVFSYAGEMEACMYAGAVKQADGRLTGWQRYTSAQREADSVLSVKQDVKLLNEKVIDYTVEKPLLAIVAQRGIQAADYDWYLPHYSSNFFRDKVYAGMQRAGLDIPQSRWFTNLDSKGNTGSASIYIMLDELCRSGRVQRGQRLLCYIPESGRFSTAFMQLTAV